MAVMDEYSRKIVGFSIQKEAYTGASVCRMFNDILEGASTFPKRISTDNNPIFKSNRWLANLRISEIEEIKSLAEIPCSHPFIERLIGSTRRECLDQTLFWAEADLKRKLDAYRQYYNEARVHYSITGVPPNQFIDSTAPDPIDLDPYAWKKYCGGLYSVPIPA